MANDTPDTAPDFDLDTARKVVFLLSLHFDLDKMVTDIHVGGGMGSHNVCLTLTKHNHVFPRHFAFNVSWGGDDWHGLSPWQRTDHIKVYTHTHHAEGNRAVNQHPEEVQQPKLADIERLWAIQDMVDVMRPPSAPKATDDPRDIAKWIISVIEEVSA